MVLGRVALGRVALGRVALGRVALKGADAATTAMAADSLKMKASRAERDMVASEENEPRNRNRPTYVGGGSDKPCR